MFQEYVPPPDAVRTTESPVHNVVVPLMEITGGVKTVTVDEAVSEHNPEETATE